MSSQSYLDNIELKTGKTPRDFIALAEAKGFTDAQRSSNRLELDGLAARDRGQGATAT